MKYTDNAKIFISFINIGIVGCLFLFFFILYEPDVNNVTYSIPKEHSASLCDARNFIGYVDANNVSEQLHISESVPYSLYCLKRTGRGQWSVYAN
ncbi:hypothetical protein FNI11_05660 [Salmonella enterica subsp. salamae]|nr:hypothetical protein [Salmonella enterica subsp. salamae]ECJ2280404.1 hypothetical protein [Salmonella enterica subsp. salamae]